VERNYGGVLLGEISFSENLQVPFEGNGLIEQCGRGGGKSRAKEMK